MSIKNKDRLKTGALRPKPQARQGVTGDVRKKECVLNGFRPRAGASEKSALRGPKLHAQ
jgi:hypothetical protein